MGDETTYWIRWNGFWSNCTYWICAVLTIVLLMTFITILIRRLRSLWDRRVANDTLQEVGMTLGGMSLWLIGLVGAVLAARYGNLGNSSIDGARGGIQGYARSRSNTQTALITAAILYIPAGIFITVQNTFYEPPLAIAVTSKYIKLIHRNSWEDTTIFIGKIQNVTLIKEKYRDSGFAAERYVMTLDCGSAQKIRITSDERSVYQDRLVSAYTQIEDEVVREKTKGAAL